MGWKNDVTKIVRALVNDLDQTTYSDSRIEEMAIVAAYQVNSNISFSYTYTVSLSTEAISPDPSDNADNDFITLTALKAACNILRSEAKTKAASAISMTDGASTVSMKGVYDALKSEADDLCEKFEQAKKQFIMSGGVGGLAILSPYSPGSDDAHGRSDRDGASFFE
jgi:hypothetical protein